MNTATLDLASAKEVLITNLRNDNYPWQFISIFENNTYQKEQLLAVCEEAIRKYEHAPMSVIGSSGTNRFSLFVLPSSKNTPPTEDYEFGDLIFSP